MLLLLLALLLTGCGDAVAELDTTDAIEVAECVPSWGCEEYECGTWTDHCGQVVCPCDE